MAETAERWTQEWKQEGEAQFFLRLLVRRMGQLPSWVYEMVQAADIEDLETWGDRLLDARSLADVFAPHESNRPLSMPSEPKPNLFSSPL